MGIQRQHILSSFDEGLNYLRDSILMMASLAERSLNRCVKALYERNEADAKICIGDDEEIDMLEIDIDRLGVDLLVRFGPVASDLRHVVSGMKVCQNLERISDAAVGISRKLVKLLRLEFYGPEIDELRPLSEKSIALFKESIRCYHLHDLETARHLKGRDREIDQLTRELAEHFTEMMTESPARVPALLELIFITRHFERIADHATNIAEDVVFGVSNEDIRHTG